MRIYETDRDPREQVLAALTSEPSGPDTKVAEIVRDIIADVRERGDNVLLELERKFDAPDLQSITVSDADFDNAYKAVKPDLLDAIRTAKANIEAFHQKQLQKSWMDMHDDFVYGQIVRPIENVGFYAPAWHAPLASTVLMTAIPGRVAGVKQLVMCCPPQKDGNVHPAMLVAAKECGVTNVFKLGGAGAVAAMAYGTRTVPKVDKIVGPGSTFVTEAKRQLFGVVGIDQLAGPSEILVLADESANPTYAAADIISQAEHGPDSRCVLITHSRSVADAVLTEVKRQAEIAGRREFVKESLDKYGVIVIAQNLDECIELSNYFAPEHLEICLVEPWEALKKIKNAGAIMIGHYTPVPLCDFAAGPNHTLPTNGTARFSSALSVDDFIKKSGLLSYTDKALKRIAPTVIEMANAEGLEGHANTIKVRVQE